MTTSPKVTPSSPKRGLSSLALRPKSLSIGVVGLLGMAAIGLFSVNSLNSMDAAAAEINAARNIQTESTALQADLYNIKGVQNRYMLQAHVDGPAVADPNNPARKGYLLSLIHI